MLNFVLFLFYICIITYKFKRVHWLHLNVFTLISIIFSQCLNYLVWKVTRLHPLIRGVGGEAAARQQARLGPGRCTGSFPKQRLVIKPNRTNRKPEKGVLFRQDGEVKLKFLLVFNRNWLYHDELNLNWWKAWNLRSTLVKSIVFRLFPPFS